MTVQRRDVQAHIRARVIATFGRQSLIADDDRIWQATRRGKRGDVVVGDCVQAAVTSAEQARIQSIEPRSTLLFRADAHRIKELAANIDQAIIVYAVRPAFNRWFIWKALVAAGAAGIDALVVRNKTDLADDATDAIAFLQQIAGLGWRTLSLSAKADADRSLGALMREVEGRKSLLVGQSGMGKSTLLNLLVPDARARTQDYSQRLNVGKQTTTASRWFALDAGAVVDAPGFHEFGLAHLSLNEIAQTFPEFKPLLGRCRFLDCRHLQEPDCAIRAAVAAGGMAPERYDFYRALAEASL